MRYLVDTSVLVRSVHAGDPRRPLAKDAIAKLLRTGHRLCIVPQNIAEFWAVCTRPGTTNGLGFTQQRARRYIGGFAPIFELIYETPEVYREWQRMLNETEIPGRQIHDARLAAAATVHRLDAILTFDFPHFQRFAGVKIVDPKDVANS